MVKMYKMYRVYVGAVKMKGRGIVCMITFYFLGVFDVLIDIVLFCAGKKVKKLKWLNFV